MKSKTAATLLALFLGGIGIHKFYLGKWVQGTFYLLFFWTMIPSIIAFIEFVRYICMSDAEFNTVYNKHNNVTPSFG
jgi:TM2 domain-containing membrane protein YozV